MVDALSIVRVIPCRSSVIQIVENDISQICNRSSLAASLLFHPSPPFLGVPLCFYSPYRVAIDTLAAFSRIGAVYIVLYCLSKIEYFRREAIRFFPGFWLPVPMDPGLFLDLRLVCVSLCALSKVQLKGSPSGLFPPGNPLSSPQ